MDYMTFNSRTFVDADEDTSNFARVVCLLMEKGTACMRVVMERHLPTNSRTLEDAISNYRETLSDVSMFGCQRVALGLKSPNSPAINKASFDMSIWYILIRNISTLRFIRWDKLEKASLRSTQIDVCHDVMRLNKIRNNLVHLPYPKLTSAEFDEIWKNLKTVLMRLDPVNITEQVLNDEYMLKQAFEPKQTLTYLISLQRQVHRDLETHYRDELRKKRLIKLGAVVTVAMVILAAAVTVFFILTFSQTWVSCIKTMTFVNSSNTVAISWIPRHGWRAEKPRKQNPRLAPRLDYAVISVTQATGRCGTTDDCCTTMQRIQKLAFDANDDDIMFNFLVGQDAVVYEGRNMTQGAAVMHWNNRSVSIGFLGTFTYSPPNDDSVNTALNFLQYLVDINTLSRNFTLYGMCQVRNFPDAPGCEFYRRMKTWKATAPGSTWTWRDREGSVCNTLCEG